MMGYTRLFRQVIKASLAEDIEKQEGMRYFFRGFVKKENDLYTVSTTGEQGSGILKSMVRANGLIVLPENITIARKGDDVSVQLLDGSLDLADTINS